MKTYGLVKSGKIISHFSTDRDKSEFPEKAVLYELPDGVGDGWTTPDNGVTWAAPILMRSLSPFEFLSRFTVDERKAIFAVARTNDDIQDAINLSIAAQIIYPDSARASATLDLFVNSGAIAVYRKAEILA